MKSRLAILVMFLALGFLAAGLIGCSTTSTTAASSGVTDPSHPPSARDLSASTYVGVDTCKTCHGSKYTEWKNSKHANVHSIRATSMAGGCGFCHATGYKQTGGYAITDTYTKEGDTTGSWMYTVQCEACHGPGSQHVAKAQSDITSTEAIKLLINKTPSAEATCGRCHRGRPFVIKDANGRYDSLVDMNDKTAVNASIEAVRLTSGTGIYHPIHYRPNLPVFKGTGGYEYSGSTYTSSYHTSGVSNACVVCHFQFGTDVHDPAPDLAACQSCHADAASFDVGGRLTEIQGLLKTLAVKLASYEAAVPRASRTADSYTKALWNYYLITREADAGAACAGAHNYLYSKQLLQDAIDNFDPNNP